VREKGRAVATANTRIIHSECRLCLFLALRVRGEGGQCLQPTRCRHEVRIVGPHSAMTLRGGCRGGYSHEVYTLYTIYRPFQVKRVGRAECRNDRGLPNGFEICWRPMSN